jgi:hypothetical protein
MALSIPPVSSAPVRPPSAALPRAPVPKAPSAGSSTAGTSSSKQETAALNQALSEYEADISQGQPAGALKSLARQITADAALLGRAVSIPQAPATATPSSVTASDDTSPAKAGVGRLNTLT